MSAMWELREGLRERGESWHKWPDEDSTTWQAYSNPHTATESMDGTLIVTGLTPAQAIAATLEPTDPRERGLIPHFWTGDWTLHIEAARLPERIDVTLQDQRGREVYSARVHRFVSERKDVQEVLERRIDELCAEVERLHADQAHWELGNCPSCPNVVSLQEALEQNAKLRELVSGLEHCAGGFVCDCCPLYDPSGTNHRRCESLEQELGIRVD